MISPGDRKQSYAIFQFNIVSQSNKTINFKRLCYKKIRLATDLPSTFFGWIHIHGDCGDMIGNTFTVQKSEGILLKISQLDTWPVEIFVTINARNWKMQKRIDLLGDILKRIPDACLEPNKFDIPFLHWCVIQIGRYISSIIFNETAHSAPRSGTKHYREGRYSILTIQETMLQDSHFKRHNTAPWLSSQTSNMTLRTDITCMESYK